MGLAVTSTRRRRVLVGLICLPLALTGLPAAGAGPDDGSAGRFDQPFSGFAPASTTLVPGEPEEVGLQDEPIAEARTEIAEWTQGPGGTDGEHPLYAGAVSVLGHDGTVVSQDHTGWELRYADGDGTELPEDEWEPVEQDTIFDMASVSKLFTSIVVLQQVEAGRVALDDPVAQHVPEFAVGGKKDVTVRHLLTHTGGLPPFIPLWRDYPDVESRIQAALTVEPETDPGEKYVYSDLSMITLGVLAERVSGNTLDELVHEGITEPLGMVDTGYNPSPEQVERTAATEFQATPDRGMVRGEVHDENAWSLGGIAGHAGIFSTGSDMAILAQAMLGGGAYGGERILTEDSVEAMITDENSEFRGNAHGLGFEIDQRWYMSGLSGPRSVGHTGYTGTSLVLDYDSRSFAVLLTNRVHPSRDWGSNNPARRALAQGLAEALRLPPRHGDDAWSAAITPDTTSTIQAAIPSSPAGSRIAFDLFVDTEETDVFALESSVDGGQSWQPVPFEARERGSTHRFDGGTVGASGHRTWWQVTAHGPEQPVGSQLLLRWRHTTDALYNGRGVLIDGVRVTVRGHGTVLDGEHQPESFTLDGWERVEG